MLATSTVRSEALCDFVREIAEAAGATPKNALQFAEFLVRADLEGLASHGVSRLPAYVKRIEAGLMDPRTRGRVIHERVATATLDGEHGIGQVLAARAADLASDLATSAGAAWVGVRRSNHFGVAGHFAERVARRGYVGFVACNTPPGIPPWGGYHPYFGTNPIAFAFPTEKEPVVIDLSTSVAARGKIMAAAASGESIPDGWALDEVGRPTTDPAAALRGSVLPMAGPKGYALALAVEFIAAILTGAGFGPHTGSMYADWDNACDHGHIIAAIDPEALSPDKPFRGRASEMVEEVLAQPVANGASPIRMPGARRLVERERRERFGIPLEASSRRELTALGKRLGVEAPFANV